jgi:hypothetical protein
MPVPFTPAGTPAAAAAPAFSTGGGFGGGMFGPQTPNAGVGLGWNLGSAQLGVQGLASLGNLWSAWQSNQLATKAFNFQRGMAERNLANSISSYNTQLEDRARARGHTEGQDAATTAAYIERNRLSR